MQVPCVSMSRHFFFVMHHFRLDLQEMIRWRKKVELETHTRKKDPLLPISRCAGVGDTRCFVTLCRGTATLFARLHTNTVRAVPPHACHVLTSVAQNTRCGIAVATEDEWIRPPLFISEKRNTSGDKRQAGRHSGPGRGAQARENGFGINTWTRNENCLGPCFLIHCSEERTGEMKTDG